MYLNCWKVDHCKTWLFTRFIVPFSIVIGPSSSMHWSTRWLNSSLLKQKSKAMKSGDLAGIKQSGIVGNTYPVLNVKLVDLVCCCTKVQGLQFHNNFVCITILGHCKLYVWKIQKPLIRIKTNYQNLKIYVRGSKYCSVPWTPI